MRLSLCLLLIVLAVQCYETNAGMVCKPVLRESLTFLLKSKEALEEELQKYSAPQEAVEAKLKVKECVDGMLYTDKLKVAGVLTQVLIECGAKGWLEQYFPNLVSK